MKFKLWGLIDLPPVFSYQVGSELGRSMDGGHRVPDRADGMGCVRLDGGRIALVRNHELQPKHLATGPFAAGTPASAEAFDRIGDAALPGGTMPLLLDSDTLTVEKHYLSLVGMIDRKSTRLNSSHYCAPRMTTYAFKKE